MKKFVISAICALLGVALAAQTPEGNRVEYYQLDAEAYPVNENYSLPDLLVCNSGKTVNTVKEWEKVRRPEILSMFTTEMYGEVPGKPAGLHFALAAPDSVVYDGAGIRRRVRIFLDAEGKHSFDVLVHLPAKHDGKIPMFVGLNFHNIEESLEQNRHTWPFEMIVREGFGVAEAYHSQIEPDGREFDMDVVSASVRSWYKPAEEWGAISAWAWGISRIVDYLETLPEVDCGKIAVIGHSRLGKTALWAAANDRRLAMAVSNNSGCCGAALSRRGYGETFEVIGRNFPHWFVPEFNRYSGKDNEFPTDQHGLIALCAPRPVYVASAAEDHWADPIGEWTAAYEAAPVYKLYGLKGLSRSSMQPLGHTDDFGSIAYKIRSGEHALWPDDWCDYIKFAKRQFYQGK